MSSCIICGDRESTTSSGKRFQPIYEALKVDIHSIPGWNLDKESVPLCSPCSQISDCLSKIVKQLKSLEQDYLGKTLELKKLLKNAELKDETGAGAVNTFRKLALGLKVKKIERAKKQRKCAKNKCPKITTPLENRFTIKNALSESEQSSTEETDPLDPFPIKKNKSARKTEDNLDSSFSIDNFEIEVKEEEYFVNVQEIEESNNFFTVEEVETFQTQEIEENVSDAANNIKSTRSRTTRSKIDNRVECETDPPDFNCDAANSGDDKESEYEEESSEDDTQTQEKARLKNTIRKHPTQTNKWTSEKNPAKMRYDGVEVTKVANGLECSICQTVIPLKSGIMSRAKLNMRVHIISKHLGNFVCHICNRKLGTQRSLNNHVKGVHEKTLIRPIIRKVCEVCQKPFSNQANFLRHIWTHMNEEEEKAAIASGQRKPNKSYEMLQCEKCGQICKGKHALKSHEEKHIDLNDREKFICQDCGAILYTEGGLKNHIKNKHEENNQLLQCPRCDKKFNREGLRTHMQRHEKKVVCEQCGERFSNKTRLTIHRLRHEKKRPHECLFCDMAFYQKQGLNSHTKSYHDPNNPNPLKRKVPYWEERRITVPRTYTCQICGLIYKEAGSLRKHIKLKHEENKPIPCPKDGCDKEFASSVGLRGHLLNHDKPIACDVEGCGKRFPNRYKLVIHKLRHENIRPHKCPHDCDRAYYQSGHLTSHIKACHNTDKPSKAKKKSSENKTKKALPKRIRNPPSSTPTSDLSENENEIADSHQSHPNYNSNVNNNLGDEAYPSYHSYSITTRSHNQY